MTDPAPQPSVPLSALVFDDAVNVRQNGKADDEALEALAASLQADGVLSPLIVYPLAADDNLFAVADGGRRLAALHLLRERGRLAADHPVPVAIRPRAAKPGDEKAVSLAVNLLRAPLHPVDAYDAFAGLADAGMTPAGIAARYGVSEREASQRLAVGRLAPEIRAAWREGRFGNRAAEIAAAFTLAPDHAMQTRVLAKLEKDYPRGFSIYHVKDAILGADAAETLSLLNFVGREAYSEAGGQYRDSLFGDEVWVSDPPLLKTLAEARLEAECARLRASGWAHAETRDAVGANASRLKPRAVPPEVLDELETEDDKALRVAAVQAREAYDRVVEIFNDRVDAMTEAERDVEEPKLDVIEEAAEAAEANVEALDADLRRRAFEADPSLRGETCCLVSIDDKGRLTIEAGLEKPKSIKTLKADPSAEGGKGKARPKGPEQKAKSSPAGLDGKAMKIAANAATRAARRVVAGDADLALALAVANLDFNQSTNYVIQAGGFDYTFDPAEDGPPRPRDRASRLDFAARLAECRAATREHLLAVLAVHVARALNLTFFKWDQKKTPWPHGEMAAVLAALPAERLAAALAAEFDPASWLKAAGKDGALQVIREAVPDGSGDSAKSFQKKKEKEVIAYAADKARETGWLPPALRFANYAGPASSANGTAKPKKARAEKPKPGNPGLDPGVCAAVDGVEPPDVQQTEGAAK